MDLDGEGDRLDHAWELEQKAVARSADDAPAMSLADGFGSGAVLFQAGKVSLFVLTYEPAVAGHIDSHDGGKPALRIQHQALPYKGGDRLRQRRSFGNGFTTSAYDAVDGSPTCRGEEAASRGMDRQVSDKAQGRKPRASWARWSHGLWE